MNNYEWNIDSCDEVQLLKSAFDKHAVQNNIKQNDHDVCKTGLDKEHAGVDVWAKSLSFAVGKES